MAKYIHYLHKLFVFGRNQVQAQICMISGEFPNMLILVTGQSHAVHPGPEPLAARLLEEALHRVGGHRPVPEALVPRRQGVALRGSGRLPADRGSGPRGGVAAWPRGPRPRASVPEEPCV